MSVAIDRGPFKKVGRLRKCTIYNKAYRLINGDNRGTGKMLSPYSTVRLLAFAWAIKPEAREMYNNAIELPLLTDKKVGKDVKRLFLHYM